MKLPLEQNDPIKIRYDGSGVWPHTFIFSLHRCCTFQALLLLGTWRLSDPCPSSANSHSCLLLILRTFMTYDFAPAWIPSWGHIVGSYLALAWTHLSRSCPFFLFFFFLLRRSFLVWPKQTRAAEKPWCESCGGLITNRAPACVTVNGRTHARTHGCSLALHVWPCHLLLVRAEESFNAHPSRAHAASRTSRFLNVIEHHTSEQEQAYRSSCWRVFSRRAPLIYYFSDTFVCGQMELLHRII